MADFTFAHREEGFDTHIEQSIRGYGHLMSDVVSLSRHFVEDDTNVVDIGCSTGKMTQQLLEENKDHSLDIKTLLKAILGLKLSLLRMTFVIMNLETVLL